MLYTSDKGYAHPVNSSGVESLRYIERKDIAQSRIDELLALSAVANQWTNFGPVCRVLEDTLTQILEIPDHLGVVACSNATVALHTLAAMHSHLRGKPMRWATSAFGFYSSCDGILSTAEIVDCNQDGMLDLELLAAEDLNKLDGLIVTNIFGHYQHLRAFQEFVEQNSKVLLVDGAMAFHGQGHLANTCISLHHTKPWGFGEGGCAIVEKQHVELFRDMLAFGHPNKDAAINRLATNGKISDVACAYQLMRLDELTTCRQGYQEQHQRICSLGASLGLSVLGAISEHPGIPANVPFLFPLPTLLPEDIRFPARKYYHPLSNAKNAVNIYQRIINVACHSQMNQLSDGQILAFLSELMAQNG